jgi:hypothetical protein
MKDMTREQASEFIQALERLPRPTTIGRREIPPTIPKGRALIDPEFLKRDFKTPTPAKFITSQYRYAELLGVKDLVSPLEQTKIRYDEEAAIKSHAIEKATKLMKRSKINPERMAQLVNIHEETPPELAGKEKEIFDFSRDLTREIWTRMNEGRHSAGLDPIPYRKAFFRHIADRMSEEVIEGKYPIPENIKYWADQTVSKRVFNPMEMRRKLRDDLLEHFSKDYEYAMKAMVWTGLKDAYFSAPKAVLNKQLGILSKDKKVYDNLTPEERVIYDKQMTMPASTRRWLMDYVNQQLLGRQTRLDESVDSMITKSAAKDILNSILIPFGKHIGQKPFTTMVSAISRLPIYGALGGLNPKQLLRNKMQTIQNMALYGIRNTLRGFLPTKDFPTLEKLKTDSLFKKSYSGFEELPVSNMKKLERIGLAPYQWTAVSNVSQAMNAAYHWTADLVQDPKKKGLGWADPQRTYTEDKNFFYPSEEAKLLKEMEYGAHTTQYMYIGMGMPEVFRHKALAPLTRLQSWWMNHYTVFHREAATRAFSGHTGYDPNLRIHAGARANYLKYLILGGFILTSRGYYRSYLFGTAPTGLPPTAQLAMGLYNYALYSGKKEGWAKRRKAQAERQIKESAKIHLPGYLTIKDTAAFLSGKKPLDEYMFYNKRGATSHNQ